MDQGRAKIFMHGRSQAVRLPKEFRLPGKEVRVSRHGAGVLLEPLSETAEARRERLVAMFTAMDALGPSGLEGDWREQPAMPKDRPIFDD